MQVKKRRRPPIIVMILGGLIFAYCGYMINGAWERGIDFNTFWERLNENLAYPLNDYYDSGTIRAVVIALIIYVLILLIYITSQKKLMPGKEYGTAEFGDPVVISRELKAYEPGGIWILSAHMRMNIDDRITFFNCNIFVIGGSGSGKSLRVVIGNLLQMLASYLITDPKGELLKKVGNVLRENGYEIKVLNLVDMTKSDGYNPLDYIRDMNDIQKLATGLIENTSDKKAMKGEQFWQDMEKVIYVMSISYVCLEEPPERRNFRTVLQLIREAELPADPKKKSKLAVRMEYLAQRSPLGENHPSYVQFRKLMSGAPDTIRSVIISANARMARFENENLLRILDHDELKLEELGIGRDGDGRTKTALFCVIPDADTTYNFLVGMLYSQAFERLYETADFCEDGRLPIHVTAMMDEFANVALPEGFTKRISTMRSRGISATVIIQNMAQIRALFKDDWETIIGNCDTMVYLGGNEQSTHEYISKMLGKMTIDKRSYGESRGRQGSSSRNYDVLGRDLMTPDEVGRLDNNKCIVKIRGKAPVIDEKYSPWEHELYPRTVGGGGKPFDYDENRRMKEMMRGWTSLLTPYGYERYEKLADTNENIYIESMTFDEFDAMSVDELAGIFRDREQEKRLAKIHEDEDADSVGTLRYMPAEDIGESEEAEDDESESVVGALIRKRKAELGIGE